MKTLKSALIATALGGALAAGSAHAIPITVTGMAYSNPTTVQIQSIAPSTNLYVYAGGFNTTDGQSAFISWCVDILQHTYFNQTVTNYSLVNAAAVAHIGATRADALGRLATQYLGLVNNAATSAAFQLAAWEIVYENGNNAYSMSTGNFRAWNASSGAVGIAQTWLTNLGNANNYDVNVYVSGTRQDLAVFAPTPVPEPATLGLMAAGLVGLAALRRRKQDA